MTVRRGQKQLIVKGDFPVASHCHLWLTAISLSRPHTRHCMRRELHPWVVHHHLHVRLPLSHLQRWWSLPKLHRGLPLPHMHCWLPLSHMHRWLSLSHLHRGCPLPHMHCWHSLVNHILPNIFPPLEMINVKIWETPLAWHAKCSLPVVDGRRHFKGEQLELRMASKNGLASLKVPPY